MMEVVVGSVLASGILALAGWVWNINTRVTILETERQRLDSLEELFSSKMDNMERIIELKLLNISLKLGHIEQKMGPSGSYHNGSGS